MRGRRGAADALPLEPLASKTPLCAVLATAPFTSAGARGVGADVVARDRAVIDVVEVDALLGVARDDVALGRARAADQQPAAVERIDALAAVGRGGGAGGVQADPVALDRVVVRAADLDAGAA